MSRVTVAAARMNPDRESANRENSAGTGNRPMTDRAGDLSPFPEHAPEGSA